MARQTAAILLIGEELLSGKIDDLNGSYAIQHLREIGVELRELRLIGDTIDEIGTVVRELAARYDIVFTSGGVGPTHDDLTMRGLAKAFDAPLQTNKHMLAIIQQRFGSTEEGAKVWARMADLPVGCEVVISEATRVPIFRMRNVWALPGIPELFRLQFDQIIRGLHGRPVSIRTLFLTVGEGMIATHLEETIRQIPTIKIGSYPVLHADDHMTRVTLEHEDENVVHAAVAMLLDRFPTEWVRRIGDNFRINEDS